MLGVSFLAGSHTHCQQHISRRRRSTTALPIVAAMSAAAQQKPLPTSSTILRVGCVGGGQLGRMMAMEAPRLNIQMNFLDSTGTNCPAAQVVGKSATRIIEGSLYDTSKLRALVDLGCDVVTMEIEHVGVDGLAQLESEGVNVQPCTRVVRLIQDKYAQKVRNF